MSKRASASILLQNLIVSIYVLRLLKLNNYEIVGMSNNRMNREYLEMETGTVLILLFIVATAISLSRAAPGSSGYTVALVITGLVLGVLHAFDAPHLTKALMFNVFLPGLLFGGGLSHRV